MTYETNYTNDKYSGNRAETEIVIGELTERDMGIEKPAQRILTISTHKAYNSKGWIASYASVCIVYETRNGYKAKRTDIFGDYSKRFNQQPAKVVTAKAIKLAHDVSMQQVESIIAEAKAYYEKKAIDNKAV